jgi:hypothetical protein
MEEKEYWGFNWTALFIVTACSLFIFSLAIKIVDGDFPNLLLIISVIAGVLGVISWLMGKLAEQFNRKRKERRFISDATAD